MEESVNSAQFWLDVISTFSGVHPSKMDYYSLASFFESLDIAEIRWAETVRGKLVEDVAVYQTQAAKADDPFSRNYICNDALQRTITIYRKADAAPWNDDKCAQVECFAQISYICGSNFILRNLAYAAENVDRDTNIPTLPVMRRQVEMLCTRGMTDQFAALYINLKNCKHINKKYGYPVGTQLLRAFSQALNSKTHPEQHELLIRLGGDNFIALISKENLEAFLEVLRDGLSVSIHLPDRGEVSNHFCARAGVFVIEDKHCPFGLIMNNTGCALPLTRIPPYHDFVYFDDATERSIMRRTELEVHLAEALANGEFIVYYQPKVSASERRLVGSEALVRWKHGDEMISPGEFIPLCEQNGFVAKIDYYVLEIVCRQMRAWIDEGAEPVPVSVNFSRVHFEEEALVERIFEIVNRYHVPPQYIEIEFTETVSFNEIAKLTHVVTRLKEMGIAVSMDDFGSGYSSLSLLQDLNFDVIKIDRSLCDVSNKRKSVLLEHVIRMARALDMCVVCEGVEFADTYHMVEEVGCDMIQGFLFDRPLPQEVYEQRLANKQYNLKV